MVTRRSAIAILAGAILSGSACAQEDVPVSVVPANLAFRIVHLPVKLKPDVLALMATYGYGPDETRFLILLEGESHGAIYHVPDSHPARFFAELAKSLGATTARLSNDHKIDLPFDMAILGPPTRRSIGGGFGGGPGDWYATKIFLGPDQSEVYFNFNLVSGEADFGCKDESYGDAVVSELSRVIW